MTYLFFSLIEILVVLAILSLVSTILMPAIRAAIYKAQESVCAGNLLIINTGFSCYALDNRGLFPHEDFSSDQGECWYDVIPHYVNLSNNNQEYLRESLSTSEDIYSPESRYFSYKMNSRLEGYKGSPELLRPTTVRTPGNTVLLFDGRVDTQHYQTRPFGINTAVYERHPSGASILFLDGHVKAYQNPFTNQGRWVTQGTVNWEP